MDIGIPTCMYLLSESKEDAPLHVPYNWGEDFPFSKNGIQVSYTY